MPPRAAPSPGHRTSGEHDQAAGGRAGHEQRDQPDRLGRIRPIPLRQVDAQSRRVAAHEGDEHSAEMQEADAVDIAGQRAKGAGQSEVAARVKHLSVPGVWP